MIQRTITGVIAAMTTCVLVGYGQDIRKSEHEQTTQRSKITMKELGRSGVFEIPMISGSNIDLSVGVGSAVSLTPRSQPGWFYGIVDCVAGDHFVINGKGGVVPRLWGFLDRNNIVLSVADVQVTADRLRLTAPANASKLVINNDYDSPSYAGQGAVTSRIDSLKSSLVSRISILEDGDYIAEVPDDTIAAMIRGVKFSDEIKTPIVDFIKNGDLMVHVSTFCIINDVAYATYFVSTRGTREWPGEHTARFAYCPLSDPGNKTYVDLCDIGDVIDGKKVTAINDTIILRKDDTTLYLAWTAAIGGQHHRLYRTFDVTTKTLSDVSVNSFTVGSVKKVFSKSGIEAALKADSITHKPLDTGGGIGIMPKLSSRDENGTTYYYTGLFYGQFNCIIKSADLVNWEFVAVPDFEIDSLWENAVYVLGDKAFYFVRQSWSSQYGVLTCCDLEKKAWASPVYVDDASSRSDFIVHKGVLCLIHAPKDRSHISLMQINQKDLNKSYEIQTARVPDYFFPYVDHYNGELYMSYTASRKHIYLAKFTIGSLTTDAILDRFRELFFGGGQNDEDAR